MTICIFVTLAGTLGETVRHEFDSERFATFNAGAELVSDDGEITEIESATLVEFNERGRASGHCRDVTSDVIDAAHEYAAERATETAEWQAHTRMARTA